MNSDLQIDRYDAQITSAGFSFKVNNSTGIWCKYEDAQKLAEDSAGLVADKWLIFYKQEVDNNAKRESELSKAVSSLKFWTALLFTTVVALSICLIA